MPSLSVIIPYFENHDRLPATLATLRCHTSDAEILIIDDASPATPILDNCARSGDLTVLRQPDNQGPAAARNRGINAARCDWIFFLDSDDQLLLDPRAMLDGAPRGIDIAIGSYRQEGRYPLLHRDLPRVVSYAKDPVLVKKMGFSANLYRRSFLSGCAIDFPTDMPVGEDVIFMVRALAAAQGIWLSDGETFSYDRRPGSLSAVRLNNRSMEASFQLLPDRLMQALSGYPEARAIRFYMMISQRLKDLARLIDGPDFDRAAMLTVDVIQRWGHARDSRTIGPNNVKWDTARDTLVDDVMTAGVTEGVRLLYRYSITH